MDLLISLIPLLIANKHLVVRSEGKNRARGGAVSRAAGSHHAQPGIACRDVLLPRGTLTRRKQATTKSSPRSCFWHGIRAGLLNALQQRLFLHQLSEDAVARLGMDEADLPAVRAGSRRLIDEANTRLP